MPLRLGTSPHNSHQHKTEQHIKPGVPSERQATDAQVRSEGAPATSPSPGQPRTKPQRLPLLWALKGANVHVPGPSPPGVHTPVWSACLLHPCLAMKSPLLHITPTSSHDLGFPLGSAALGPALPHSVEDGRWGLQGAEGEAGARWREEYASSVARGHVLHTAPLTPDLSPSWNLICDFSVQQHMAEIT